MGGSSQFIPQNGHLLVKTVEPPTVGLLQQRVASKCWLFGTVLDKAFDVEVNYVDCSVMFLGQLGIKLNMKNDQDQHETHYLIEAKHIVSCLRV